MDKNIENFEMKYDIKFDDVKTICDIGNYSDSEN